MATPRPRFVGENELRSLMLFAEEAETGCALSLVEEAAADADDDDDDDAAEEDEVGKNFDAPASLVTDTAAASPALPSLSFFFFAWFFLAKKREMELCLFPLIQSAKQRK